MAVFVVLAAPHDRETLGGAGKGTVSGIVTSKPLGRIIVPALKRNPYLYETINQCHEIPFPHREPVRPASVKNYSSKYDSFWCCTGTGMQAPAKFGKMIYSAAGDTLSVNMFISSDLQWKDEKVSLTMETAFPADDKVKLAIGSGGGKRFGPSLSPVGPATTPSSMARSFSGQGSRIRPWSRPSSINRPKC